MRLRPNPNPYPYPGSGSGWRQVRDERMKTTYTGRAKKALEEDRRSDGEPCPCLCARAASFLPLLAPLALCSAHDCS